MAADQAAVAFLGSPPFHVDTADTNNEGNEEDKDEEAENNSYNFLEGKEIVSGKDRHVGLLATIHSCTVT